MPGAYAHITLVHLAKDPARLQQAGLPNAAIAAIGSHLRLCELGALSPDYPCFSRDPAQHGWADRMHFDQVGKSLAAGIRAVRGLNGFARKKAFAWLLGYAAHVVADMTIHPVIERKAGPYLRNRTAHQFCEIHQDAYIVQRLDLGGVGLTEYLRRGVGDCGGPDDPGAPDPAVTIVWIAMLRNSFPDAYAQNPPNFEDWHEGFRRRVDSISETGGRLLPMARHAADSGLRYPAAERIDSHFLKHLDTPIGRQSYDEVFDAAVENVLSFWKLFADAVFADRQAPIHALESVEWNLDTGRDREGRYVFWP